MDWHQIIDVSLIILAILWVGITVDWVKRLFKYWFGE